MKPWVRCPEFAINLDEPLDRRFDVVDSATVERTRGLLDSIREVIPPRALTLVPLLSMRTRGRFNREAKAIARIAEYDWRWIMLANVSYDLALANMGCSTAALATSDGPIVARNMDWWPEQKLAAASCLFRYERGGEFAFAIAGWPGSIGAVTGMSGRGFAVVLNAVLSAEGHCKSGYPVLLALRRVLEDAAGFDEAVKLLTTARLFMSGLLTVVGVTNDQRVCIERTPTRAECRWADGDGAVVTTNHYVALSALDRRHSDSAESLFASACSRYENLRHLVAVIPRERCGDSDELLTALTHESVRQQITAQHVIMQPATQRIEVYAPRALVDPPDDEEIPPWKI